MASTTEKESSLTHWDNFGGNPSTDSTAHIAFFVERDSGIKTWEPQPQPFASQTSIESETSLWESEAFMILKYFKVPMSQKIRMVLSGHCRPGWMYFHSGSMSGTMLQFPALRFSGVPDFGT
jgi:hypothetical protein